MDELREFVSAAKNCTVLAGRADALVHVRVAVALLGVALRGVLVDVVVVAHAVGEAVGAATSVAVDGHRGAR